MKNGDIFRPVNDYKNGIVATVAGTRFIVGCDDESVVLALSEYLFPGGSSPRNEAWTITSEVVDDAHFAELRERIPGSVPVSVKPGFQYLLGERDGVLRYEAEAGFEESPHLIFQHDCRLSIIGNRVDDVFRRIPLRLIREVALRQCEGEGGLFTHAACVRVRGFGLLVVGNSGAGKTTTLMKLMSESTAEFVTNDRGVSRSSNGVLTLETWPTAVRVGAGTAQASSQLMAALPELRRRENRPVRAAAAEGMDSMAARQLQVWASREKYEFTPNELSLALRRDARMGASIDLIVFPRLSLNGAPLSTASPNEEDWEVLRECLTSPVDSEWGRGWLGIRVVTDTALSASKARFVRDAMNTRAVRLTGDPSVGSASSIFDVLMPALGATASQVP